jgi:gamma-glutamyltranspeptidase/glutathione hydrolase
MGRRATLLLRAALTACVFGGCVDRGRAPGPDAPAPPAAWTGGVVAADHPLASEAGAKILRAGGNAVDAAVASSLALSVVRPYSCGIGGGGFMVVRLADDPTTPEPGDPLEVAIDYRERAPMAMTPGHFEDLPEDASRFSGSAVAVPGTVAGLLHALERYGTMDRRAVLAPAIRLARDGFALDHSAVDAADELAAFLDAGDETPRGAAFLRARLAGGGAASVGDTLRLPEQARALELIAERGRDGFYAGEVAAALVRAVRDAGGVMTLDDLARFQPTEGPPMVGEAFGRRWVCMPLPSSGGVTMLQILSILEQRGDLWRGVDRRDPAYLHALVESMKHAFADRAALLGDPEFVDVPVDRMLDPARLRAAASRIDPARTFAPPRYGVASPPPTDGGTSHVSVVDRWGNAVACTETINLVYGSRVAVPAFGFVLNNEMDDFLTRRGEANAFALVQDERNLPAPWKRPLSSMSPTIVVDAGGRVEAVAGASGGPRIITGTLQALLNTLVWGLDAREAVGAPRVHHQWRPDAVYVETVVWPGQAGWPLLDAAARAALEARGHAFASRREVGVVQLVRRARGGEGWEAASDPRKGGAPAGVRPAPTRR